MPFVVSGRRVAGGWRVDCCPRCGRAHRHQVGGMQRAPCGAEYLLLTPEGVSGVRAAIGRRGSDGGDDEDGAA